MIVAFSGYLHAYVNGNPIAFLILFYISSSLLAGVNRAK